MAKRGRFALKIGSHVILYFLVFLPLTLFVVLLTPYQRGFFCDDASIRLPYIEDTVTVTALMLCGLLLPLVIVLVTELIHRFTTDKRANLPIMHCNPHPSSLPCHVRCYVFMGLMMFGGAVQIVTVMVTKYAVGRLRPNFLDVCDPDWKTVQCYDETGFPRYVVEEVCRLSDEYMLTDARQSFPSGHASWGAFAAVYIVMYLEARFTWRDGRIFKVFLQCLFIWAGLYCGLSRVPDNKHHMSDVMVGFAIGASFAVFFFCNTGFVRMPSRSVILRQLMDLYAELKANSHRLSNASEARTLTEFSSSV